MIKPEPLPGGGRRVHISADRLIGWCQSYWQRNGGTGEIVVESDRIVLPAGNGSTATVLVPFGPFVTGDREPLEALLFHHAAIGEVGVILARGGAHVVGRVDGGEVTASRTRREYLHGRTAAGGWSQQRYSRRRDNQRTAGVSHTADDALELLMPHRLDGLALGGDRTTVERVLEDPRLASLTELPVRWFPDLPEPRREVLDDVAERLGRFTIEIRDG